MLNDILKTIMGMHWKWLVQAESMLIFCGAQDQLHEYFNLMHSVNTAFNERSTALLTVQTLATEISSLNTRIEKLMVASSKVFGGDKTRNRKIEDLKEALMTMEESRDSAQI